jgi:membrane protein required for colicin V production
VKLSVIDTIFIVLIILFVIRCYLKGFISEIFSMAAIVLGVLASLFFYKNGAEFIRESFLPGMKTLPEIIAFIALFVIVFVVVKLLEILLKGVIHGLRGGGIDRLLGLVFGFAEGIAVVSLVLFVLTIQPLFDSSSILAGSFFARLLLPLITGAESTVV